METSVKMEVELIKKQAIMHIGLYFILIPLVIGILTGAIVGKFKSYALKLTLIITTAINSMYLITIFLTSKGQDKPHIAIIVVVVTTVISNISAVISHKVTCKILNKSVSSS